MLKIFKFQNSEVLKVWTWNLENLEILKVGNPKNPKNPKNLKILKSWNMHT